MSKCVKYKYLEVEITNEGTLDIAIKEQNQLGKKVITILSRILWDRNINSSNKRLIYNTIIKSVITYSYEIEAVKLNRQQNRC